MTLQLRPYQRGSLDTLYGFWSEGGGNPLIVLPTGAGKSLVIATLVRELLAQWPSLRIGVITHVKELIGQNAQEMLGIWPQAPIGIYSAGLGRRDRHSRVLFMGIQSVHNKTAELGVFDVIIVDEAHLIPRSASTMYGRFFAALREVTPDMRIVGLTATPYRLDSGRLDRGKERLFDEIIYDANVRDLIEEGYLSKLISKATATRIDISGVHIRAGEFKADELQAAANRPSVVIEACREIIEFGKDRRGWLAFCTGVEHAIDVRDCFRENGISCETVTGDTPSKERDQIIAAYKAQRIRCLTSVGVLTTGFNAPHVDLIALLRPTLSTGLYVQMVGRGFRLAPGKENCLVLDFAGNVTRHGPIDAPKPKKEPGGGDGEGKAKPDDVRAKVCPECQEQVALATRYCPTCGFEWKREEAAHAAHAEDVAIMSDEQKAPKWLEVTDLRFSPYDKPSAPTSLLVEYQCGPATYREWWAFEHRGFARDKACMIWRRLDGRAPFPRTVAEAIERTGELSPITHIRVNKNGKRFDVVGRLIGLVGQKEAAE